MPLTYNTYVNQVGAILEAQVITVGSDQQFQDSNYQTALPGSIDYAENRIQRDLDLLTTLITDTSGTLTPSDRLFTLPTATGTYLTLTEVYLVIGGVRQPALTPTSREFLNAAYPSDTPLSPSPSLPVYWAMYDQAKIVIGPAPDSAYPVTVVGTQRMTQLSTTNATNWLSQWLPDLYIAAAMVYWAGFQRDFGQGSADSPQTSVNWEAIYDDLLKGAGVEQERAKWNGPGFTSRQPSPVAGPAPRG